VIFIPAEMNLNPGWIKFVTALPGDHFVFKARKIIKYSAYDVIPRVTIFFVEDCGASC
jgi:hypothetical protein